MALPENPGLAVSGGVHLSLLALALFSFSGTTPLSDVLDVVIPWIKQQVTFGNI